jgi:hypothetical protein
MRPILLRRRALASSARRYAAAGWPVAAGAWWDGARYRCPTTPCQVAGHHPAGHRPAAGTCSTDLAEVATWWATHPHTVILPTGLVHDVLDVTATHGMAAWQQLHCSGVHVPTARTPTGRLLLFVVAAAEPRPALPEPADTGGGHRDNSDRCPRRDPRDRQPRQRRPQRRHPPGHRRVEQSPVRRDDRRILHRPNRAGHDTLSSATSSALVTPLRRLRCRPPYR